MSLQLGAGKALQKGRPGGKRHVAPLQNDLGGEGHRGNLAWERRSVY